VPGGCPPLGEVQRTLALRDRRGLPQGARLFELTDQPTGRPETASKACRSQESVAAEDGDWLVVNHWKSVEDAEAAEVGAGDAFAPHQ